MKIGIFDSGMGGLSVLHRALRMIPEADFLYYADEEHVPYGEKTREQVRGYIDEIIAFMIKKQVDAIVIACNTATSVATKEYRSQFPLPIVGMEPAVKKAVEEYADRPGRILVAATPITIKGDKLHHLVDRVDKRDMVDLVALPKLVRFAEQEIFDQDQIVLLTDLPDLIQLHCLTGEIYRNDCFRPGCDQLADGRRIDIVGLRINICENRFRTRI